MAQVPVTNVCSSHSNKVYQFYCETDGKLVCRLCVTDTHKGHTFKDLGEHAKIKRKDLEEYLEAINEELSFVNSKEDQTEKMIKKTEKQHDSLKQVISQKTDDLKTEVDKSSSKYVSLLTTKQKDNTAHLANCKKEIKSHTDRLVKAKQIITTQIANKDTDMLEWMSSKQYAEIGPKSYKSSLTKLVSSDKLTECELISPSLDRKRLAHMVGLLKPIYFKQHTCSATEFQASVEQGTVSRIDFNDVSNVGHVGTLFPVEDDLAWIGFQRQQILKLVSRKSTEKTILSLCVDLPFKDMLITPYGDIILSEDRGQKLLKISLTGRKELLYQSKFYETRGIGLTKTGDVLLCLQSKDHGGKIVHLSSTGKTIAEYSKQQLIGGKPDRILQNVNEDIIIIDWGSKVIIGLNSSMSEVKFHYNGSSLPADQKGFNPHGIATDCFGHIYITDHENLKIHVLDPSGQFLSFLPIKGFAKGPKPRRVAISDNGVMWIGCDNAIVYTLELRHLKGLEQKFKLG